MRQNQTCLSTDLLVGCLLDAPPGEGESEGRAPPLNVAGQVVVADVVVQFMRVEGEVKRNLW